MPKKVKAEVVKILVVLGTAQFSQAFLFAIYTVFLVSRGLNLFEAGLVNMVYHLSIPFLEIPTGAFADVWGRKKSFLVSTLLWALALVIYGASFTVWGFVLAEFLAAVATAFASGCVDAHIWDTVAVHAESVGLGDEETSELNRTANRWQAQTKSVVGAAGGLAGAMLASWNLSLPWYVSAVLQLCAFAMGVKLITESKRSSRVLSFQKDAKRLAEVSLGAIRAAAKTKTVRELALLGFATQIILSPVFMYWSPYLKGFVGTFGRLGWIWVLLEAAIFAGILLAKPLAKRLSDKTLMAIGYLTVAVAVFVASWAGTFLVALIPLLVLEAAVAIQRHGYQMRMQEEITRTGHGSARSEENMRATLLSLSAMSSGIGGAIGLSVGGWIAQQVSISAAWTVCGLVAILVGIKVVRGYGED